MSDVPYCVHESRSIIATFLWKEIMLIAGFCTTCKPSHYDQGAASESCLEDFGILLRAVPELGAAFAGGF